VTGLTDRRNKRRRQRVGTGCVRVGCVWADVGGLADAAAAVVSTSRPDRLFAVRRRSYKPTRKRFAGGNQMLVVLL